MEWSDGSRHLFIGKHAFELKCVDITSEHAYLYRQHVSGPPEQGDGWAERDATSDLGCP